MIAIIDYGMGNVRSILNGLEYIGEDAVITSEHKKIDDADHLILPGVGAFGNAMKNIQARGLVDALERQVHEKGKPFLGICLGLQLLASNSEEHDSDSGLGWFDAEVKRFSFDNNNLKVPHVGWNEVVPVVKHPLFDNLKASHSDFYFVHSFHIVCKNEKDVAATCDYGYTFASAVYKDNIIATQFHPEKSQDNGIQILQNFVDWNP